MSAEAKEPVTETPENAEVALPPPEAQVRPFDVKSFALTGLFVLAVFYTLYFMRKMLLPLVLAMLFTLLFAPVVRALARVKIKPPLGAAIVVLSLLGLIGYAIYLL